MDIQKIRQQLAQAGLRERPSQLNMITETYEALSQKKILCLEAPTGTGKTLSYGIAAYLSKKEKQTVIISTATTALQEQLIKKDIPLISKVLEKPIQATLAKGRRRYICHTRLYNDDFDQADLFSNNEYKQKLKNKLENEHWNGDRDQLDFEINESEWQKVSTDTAGCVGKNCYFFAQCAFYRAKQKWQQSDFVITNHSLLLSDLSLGGGVLLPKLDNSVYIIDECHQFPEKALDFFAKSISLTACQDWLKSLHLLIGRSRQNELLNSAQQGKLDQLVEDIEVDLEPLLNFLQSNPNLFKNEGETSNAMPCWRLSTREEVIFKWGEKLQKNSLALINELQQLLDEYEEKIKSTSDNVIQQKFSKQVAQIGFYKTRTDNLWQTWNLFCQLQAENKLPIARWFSKNFRHEFTCHASPINISQELKKLFWDELTHGALLCSATIRALGSFADFKRKTGLKDNVKFTERALETCFDYQKSILFVPTMQNAPQGQQQNQHWQEANRLLPQLFLPKGGSLVLFSSRKAMENSYECMDIEIKKDILMQKDSAKFLLISEHIGKIQAGKRSILFGLASFGEGLDLPDDLCQHVIIHKLPFSVPTTPVELTRSEWLNKNNQDSFTLSTLPATSVRLAQYVGRLIRQETDIGIVTILDKRIYSKNYGKLLLKNLPEFSQHINVDLSLIKKNVNVMHLFNL